MVCLDRPLISRAHPLSSPPCFGAHGGPPGWTLAGVAGQNARMPSLSCPQNMSPRRHLSSELAFLCSPQPLVFHTTSSPAGRVDFAGQQQDRRVGYQKARTTPYQTRFSLSESLKTKFGGLPAADPCRFSSHPTCRLPMGLSPFALALVSWWFPPQLF